MSTQNEININHLMRNWHDGVIYTQRHLTTLGYYHDLVRRYKKGRWIEPVGRGAYKKFGDTVEWQGGIYAIQKQLGLTIYPAGRTALELLGYSHYIRFSQRIFLFGITGEKIPKWFSEADWDTTITYHQSKLFGSSNTGLSNYSYRDMTLSISAPERAAMEMLYLIPKYQGFDEADKIMNGLLALRPDVVQSLLETCQSIKVKRLFLYLAERNGVPWFENINHKKVDLGSGKRVIVKDGKYNAKYQICVPEIRDI
ncbi:type IV toxin-antitoxin system AbiEi family antitoxin domain-containing protein [bacterium]